MRRLDQMPQICFCEGVMSLSFYRSVISRRTSCSTLGEHLRAEQHLISSQTSFPIFAPHLHHNNPPKSGPWLLGSQSFPSPYCSLYICSVFSFALCFASSLFLYQSSIIHHQIIPVIKPATTLLRHPRNELLRAEEKELTYPRNQAP